MRSRIIIILSLILFASFLLSEEPQLKKITLDELFAKYLTDFKIENQIELNGKCLGYSVAKETGEIVISTEEDNQYNVHFFDFKGKPIWKKFFNKTSTIGRVLRYTPTSISNDGSTIVIHKGKYERVINMVYNHSGKLLFEKQADNRAWYRMIPTPAGEYFYEKQGATEGRVNGFYIYDRTGKEIELTGYNFEQERFIRSIFINDNKVVMYMEYKFCFFDFNAGKFNLISEYSLNTYHDFRPYFQEDVFIGNNYVLIGTTKMSSLALLFDIKGNFIRELPLFSSATFINSDEVLISKPTFKNNYIKHINLKNNKILNNQLMQNKEYYGDTIELENELLVSRIQWDAFENDIKTFIFSKETMHKISGLEELIIPTNKNIMFFSLDDNKCSVTFGYIEE